MPKRFRLTRRLPMAMTEDAYRRLRRFAADSELSEAEALSFVFETFDSIIDEGTLRQRLRLFRSGLSARRR